MRKWFRSFYSSGLFIPFILLLPYMCTIALNGADKALLLHSPGVEDMVPLMLMVQMKGDYAEEAVKAQAVIARSEVYRRLEEGESEGEILDGVNENIAGKNRERRVEQMTAVTEDEKALSFRIAELNSGRSFVVGYGGVWKLLSAVDKLQQYGAAAEATVGQVLTYNGKLKLVPYHEISSGKTRDGKEVFHSADYGYLKSVESSQDREAPDYVNSTYVPASQLPVPELHRQLYIRTTRGQRRYQPFLQARALNCRFLPGSLYRSVHLHTDLQPFPVQSWFLL